MGDIVNFRQLQQKRLRIALEKKTGMTPEEFKKGLNQCGVAYSDEEFEEFLVILLGK